MKQILALLFALPLWAGTQITDTIYLYDGAKFVGSVTVDAPTMTTAAGVTISAWQRTYRIAAGAVSINFEPNDTATPTGTSYKVTYHPLKGSSWTESWVIRTSATPLKVSDVRTTPTPIPGATVSISAVTGLQQALDAKAGALGYTPENAANKDTDGAFAANSDSRYPSQRATKTYVDTGLATKADAAATASALAGKQGMSVKGQPGGYVGIGADGAVSIGTTCPPGAPTGSLCAANVYPNAGGKYPLYVESIAGFFNQARNTGVPTGLGAAYDTSTTSIAIGVGSKTFTVTSGKNFAVGEVILIQNDATHYMFGPVTSYSGTSLVINSVKTLGTGTFASWSIRKYVDPVDMSIASFDMRMQISGGAGDTSVTVDVAPSGGIADAGGTWSGVVAHNDGTYGIYTFSACSGTACTVSPALKRNCNRAPTSNLWDLASGQHLSVMGFRAWAQYIATYKPFAAYRSQYWFQWPEYSAWTDPGTPNPTSKGVGVTGTWQRVNIFAGSLMAAGRCSGNNNASNSANSYAGGLTARSSRTMFCNTVNAGDGMMMVVPNASGNPSGTLDFYAGISAGASTTKLRVQVRYFDPIYPMPSTGGNPTPDVTMVAGSDGNIVYDEQIAELKRIVLPVPTGTTHVAVILSATMADTAFYIRAGAVTLWSTPNDIPQQMFTPNCRIAFLGDSWSTYKGMAAIRELERLLAPIGCTVHNAGKAGQTADWAVTNFASLVTPKKPTHVIVEYALNDYSAASALSADLTPELAAPEKDPQPWLANINSLITSIQALGAQPIVLMPPGTSSDAQSFTLSKWAAWAFEGTAHP